MGPESRSSAKTEARRRFWKLPVRIAKPLSLRAGDQIVLVVVRGDRGSQCCSYDYQKKAAGLWPASIDERRSEEHTSELQSLMRISYAVFCLKKKKKTHTKRYNILLERKPNHTS